MPYKVRTSIVLLFLFLFTACAGIKHKTDVSAEVVFRNCVNTWESVDYAADAIFKAFGELYEQGKISDEQVSLLIEEGDVLRQGLIDSKEAMMNYLWEKEKNSRDFDAVSKVLALADIIRNNVKSYYHLKDVATEMYSSVTDGGTLYTLDIPVVQTRPVE